MSDSNSSAGGGEDEMRIDAMQGVIQELKRNGGAIETHADGTGLLTIALRWPRTGRKPVFGRGGSFPAALTDLKGAVDQQQAEEA
jgi:hypothetical protein